MRVQYMVLLEKKTKQKITRIKQISKLKKIRDFD